MTEVRSTIGGPAVPSATLVQADQSTITGDGSRGHPLRAVPSGISGVSVDGVTILGNGSEVSPLRAVTPGLSVDGSTILGHGTATDPLRAAPARPSGVSVDGATILGDGTPAHPLRATLGSPVPALVFVDGETIAGNGTPGSPLRTIPGDGSLQMAFRGGIVQPTPGIPVFISFASQPGGVSTAQPTSAAPAPPGSPNFSAFASVHGVIRSVNSDGTVQVSVGGLLTLSLSQWDVVTGQVGGLTTGQAYFASRSASAFLVASPDPSPGSFATRVGVALSAGTMLIAPGAPTQNLGEMIAFLRFAGQSLIVGSAVAILGSGHVDAAVSDVSVDRAQAIGVVVALDVNDQPIVQVAGVITLGADQWGQVTDTSPGMVAGVAYFVATSRSPGHLTAIAPTAGAKVQIGVGINATQLVLSAPFLQRLS